MKWEFGNMDQISLNNMKGFVDSLTPRNQETLTPRNQEDKKPKTKQPINFSK